MRRATVWISGHLWEFDTEVKGDVTVISELDKEQYRRRNETRMREEAIKMMKGKARSGRGIEVV